MEWVEIFNQESIGSIMGMKLKRKKSSSKSRGQKDKTFQSPSEKGYPSTFEYIDTRGTFNKALSARDELKTGKIAYGKSSESKYGDPDFPQIAFDSGIQSVRGGIWDRTKTQYSKGQKSYRPVRTAVPPKGKGSKGGYTYSMEEIQEV